MSEYKRLTDKVLVAKLKDHYYGDWSRADEVYIRLAELEDKIENGTFFDFKVGDKVYKPRNIIGSYYVLDSGKIIKIIPPKLVIETIDEDDEFGFVSTYTEYPNTCWFTDKAEAEARLKDLQGKKK